LLLDVGIERAFGDGEEEISHIHGLFLWDITEHSTEARRSFKGNVKIVRVALINYGKLVVFVNFDDQNWVCTPTLSHGELEINAFSIAVKYFGLLEIMLSSLRK